MRVTKKLLQLFAFSLFYACGTTSNAEAQATEKSKEIVGSWTYIAYSGGIGGLHETKVSEDVKLVFHENLSCEVYTDGQKSRETSYKITYGPSSLGRGNVYFLEIGNTPLGKKCLEIRENRLILYGDHVDAMSKIYERIQ